jgi:hypothetical protein
MARVVAIPKGDAPDPFKTLQNALSIDGEKLTKPIT